MEHQISLRPYSNANTSSNLNLVSEIKINLLKIEYTVETSPQKTPYQSANLKHFPQTFATKAALHIGILVCIQSPNKH